MGVAMNCRDAAELLLAGPPEGPGSALADHLAGCPACASIAERSARLDRAWALTRPNEPTGPALDAAWARLDAALDSASRRPEVLAFPGFRPARPMPMLVRAAAVLVAGAIGLGAWNRSPVDRPALAETVIEIDVGETVLIHQAAAGPAAERLAMAEIPGSVGLDVDVLNVIETLAN